MQGPAGSFEIRPGNSADDRRNGQSAPLQPWGGDVFRTTHPSLPRTSRCMFEREGQCITGASWGPATYRPRRVRAARSHRRTRQLAKLAGRYVNDSPWFGTAIVVERGGKLWIGTETPMTQIGDNLVADRR